MFGLLLHNGDKENFKLSKIGVGLGITIFKPCLEGEWNGMKVFTTPEPSLESEPNWKEFIPHPLPETVSFVVHVRLMLLFYHAPILNMMFVTCAGYGCILHDRNSFDSSVGGSCELVLRTPV